MPEDRSSWPTVDVYIPTYNEPLEVIKPTVFAALNLDWPAEKLRVYILDDGFKGFYEQHQDYCVGNYLRMHSDENINNGNLQHYNTLFKDEVEKVHEAKRGNLCNDSILASKYTNGCPTSPIAGHNSLDRKRSCLLASPIPLKRRL